jgi:hypothetical protein
MPSFLKKVRGAVGFGILWAVPWAVAVGALSALIALFAPRTPVYGVGEWALRVGLDQAVYGGVFGFVTGVIFALVLLRAGKRRPLEQLGSARFTAMGAFAGALPAVLFVAPGIGQAPLLAMVAAVGISIGLGAACANISLRLARSPSAGGDLRGDPPLLNEAHLGIPWQPSRVKEDAPHRRT